MIDTELILLCVHLSVLTCIWTIGAYVTRFGRLTIMWDDKVRRIGDPKKVEIPVWVLCICTLTLMCFTIIYGRIVQ